MKYFSIALLTLLISCGSNQEVLTLADLKKGDKAEIISIEIPEEYKADSSLHMRLLNNVGAKIGIQGTSRGPKEANRGIIYGFDPENGNFFGLYEPQASMVIVRKLK